MVLTLHRDTGYTLAHLVEEIRHGKIALPDIQRPFVWSATQVRDLFDSMYRGYPVGTLMFWETGADAGARQVGGGDNDSVPRLLIVDGQQRLTSLYAVLTGTPVITGKFKEKTIRIAFRAKDETFEVTDAAIARDPEFITDITSLWADRYRSKVRDFLKRLGDHREARSGDTALDWNDEQDLLEERIDRVRDLRDFRFQVLELNASADAEQVAEIFVRTNSKGVQLKQADFILTLMSVRWERGRRQLEEFCRRAADPAYVGPSPRNPLIDPGPHQLLRAGVGLAFRRGSLRHVYNVLRGKDMELGSASQERQETQFQVLQKAQDEVLDIDHWHEFLRCITHAGFRGSHMVSSKNALIYTYIIWLIGKRDFDINPATLRHVIARWFFMAHTTSRYTASHEGQIEADLGRLSAVESEGGQAFCRELDRIVSSTFTKDYWNISLPNRLDSSASKSPVLSAYQAALNLLNAEALFSTLRVRDLLDPSVTAPRSMKRRHLFPKAYLASQGIKTHQSVNAIANMAYIDWPEDMTTPIGEPREYWSKITRKMEPEQLKRQIYWHALPVGWEQLDYPVFLQRRRSLLAKVVREGFYTLWEDANPPELGGRLVDLLAMGESQTVEFKSTARWNIHAKLHDKKIEHAIAKTVCGFLNAEGGKLLIGVDDDANILGLAHDMRTLGPKADKDNYERVLRQIIDTRLSTATAGIVEITFDQVGGVDVCVVTVTASGEPIFCKPISGGSPVEFWVRNGNATHQLHGGDMFKYRSNHWGD